MTNLMHLSPSFFPDDSMQLDFFGKLAARVKQALESPKSETPPPEPIPSAEAAKSAASPSQETSRALLRSLACHDLANRVQVRWNPRMRSTAGTAFLGKVARSRSTRVHRIRRRRDR